MLTINNTTDGYLKDIEIKGNTIQDINQTGDLADIRSVGDKLENQELYEIPVLCTNGLDSSDSNYKEDKLTILSPIQLEKVGDIADRIVCKDGVWGFEKNIGNYIFKGNEINGNQGTVGDIQLWYWRGANIVLKNKINTTIVIHTKLPYGDSGILNTGYEVISFNGMGENLLIDTKQSTMDEANEFISGSKLMYILETPQFIPLPYDQQIKLRTFANKTNISFECEIEPTLKASVPKSLGASVSSNTEQIDILHRELDKIKKLLLQSEVVF